MSPLLALLPFVFSTNYLIARSAPGVIEPATLAFWRWAGAALILAIIGRHSLSLNRRALLGEWPRAFLLGAIGMGVCGYAAYIAAHSTSANNIGLIYAASPLLIVLLAALFLGERLGPQQLMGMVLALLGVLTIITAGMPRVVLDLTFSHGDLWALSGSVGWAVYSILLRRWPSALDLPARISTQAAAGAIVLLVPAMTEHVGALPIPSGALAWILVVAAVLLPGVSQYLSYAWVQTRIGAARAGLIMYATPPATALTAWLVLNEPPAWFHVAGALLILPGIWLCHGRRA